MMIGIAPGRIRDQEGKGRTGYQNDAGGLLTSKKVGKERSKPGMLILFNICGHIESFESTKKTQESSAYCQFPEFASSIELKQSRRHIFAP
jgi:hypothetical protein